MPSAVPVLPSEAGAPPVLSVRVRVNEQGRIVIPAALRAAAGIEPGESVVVSLVGDHLEIAATHALVERVWALTADLPHDGSVSQSLIADRRAEARRERERR